MGEGHGNVFQTKFNRSIKVEISSDRLTSNGGVLLLRETDHQLGLVESLADRLDDPRNPNRTRYTILELMRERRGIARAISAKGDL